MLADVTRRSEEEITLIMRTGIQFVDFGLTLDARRESPGRFARVAESPVPVRLEADPVRDTTLHPRSRLPMQDHPELETSVGDSFALLSDTWLPVPFLRQQATTFVQGPANWARARLFPLEPGQDRDGYTHRLVLAFDTNVTEERLGTAYLAPTLGDVEGGVRFALAWQGEDPAWFMAQRWVSGWLEQEFSDGATPRLRLSREDIEAGIKAGLHYTHYLNIISLIGSLVRPPRIKILSNRSDDVLPSIPVDMVLDVGNSRTCGILIEDHPQQANGLKLSYTLELRDLGRAHQVYTDPFESRLEFAEASFGRVDQSVLSGRNDAFLWPTLARVGPEAARLAARRKGSEGSTGLSSPKRYLWDDERYESGWRFNDAFNRSETEPLATAAPFGNLINEEGKALFTLLPEEQIQVFVPHYSRSALMTFMLAEVLVQALVQMNSTGQRLKMSHANLPRRLRSVILTVPPSMPRPEQQIFHDALEQAVGLVWRSMGWFPGDPDTNTQEQKDACWPALPERRIQWDEATCAQAVWLYSETVNNFGGRPEDFFHVMRKPRADDPGRRLRVATIDIGGGTTDLVVTDYTLDDGRGGNVYILPEQRFRDGFKIAGDDIVLDVIRKVILPVFEQALKDHGVVTPAVVLSRLAGNEAVPVPDQVKRQQLTLQVLYPLALQVLKRCEAYDPVVGADVQSLTVAELLADGGKSDPSVPQDLLGWFAAGVARAEGGGGLPFNFLAVRLVVDPGRLHRLFLSGGMEICKPVQALCELVYAYDCDVLLLSGRPSRLPGVQALFRSLLALPPDRLVVLHGYRTGTWYPFHRNARIDDPKTTAAVGAMLCVLGQGRIPGFFFRSNVFRLYSTVRHVGLMDSNRLIKDEDIYYRDIDWDNPDYQLPEDVSFEIRGRTLLGFRQLSAPRWGASPLYLIDFNRNNRKADTALYGGGQGDATVLDVTLRPGRGRAEKLEISRISVRGGDRDGQTFSRDALKIRLFTLLTQGIGEDSYWLDTGSVVG
ncbi:virulence factor SrfB [Haematospirillum jordaniae]|uniref:virulence factor SrfB n=1 Tax=Haematospirillum jordaniae TaxID=1549855 RepID=UPI0014329026|nr:virulence factor SrfB [Haematospirillum jordaniae]NKD86309.1 virulence factor SrfB [Haematospirillum jordaniae]